MLNAVPVEFDFSEKIFYCYFAKITTLESQSFQTLWTKPIDIKYSNRDIYQESLLFNSQESFPIIGPWLIVGKPLKYDPIAVI